MQSATGGDTYVMRFGFNPLHAMLLQKEGLQALIENQAKIKSVHELEGQFLAGFAMIHAKLCWCRGIEVQIENPLIPMDLLPIEPLDFYDVEYDFLRPGWSPPPPQGLFSKIKHLLSKG